MTSFPAILSLAPPPAAAVLSLHSVPELETSKQVGDLCFIQKNTIFRMYFQGMQGGGGNSNQLGLLTLEMPSLNMVFLINPAF